MKKKKLLSGLAVGMMMLCLIGGSALATPILPGGVGSVGILTDLGVFAAGNYNLVGDGVVDLIGDGSFLMQPDGLPVSTVTAPGYNYFNPSGSSFDFPNASNQFGAAGSNIKIGALIGTFSATPSSTTDWFLIGYSTLVTLESPGHIYASVNDSYHDNNTGFFEVTVKPVPEPATILFVGIGLACMVGVRRRKK